MKADPPPEKVLPPLVRLKPKKNIATLVTGTLLIMVAIAVFMLVLPKRKPYVSITANSEFAAYRVAREKVAGIALIDVEFQGDIATCPRLATASDHNRLTGLLEPYTGSIVSYLHNNGRIAIEVQAGPQGGGMLNFAEGSPCPLGAQSRFITQAGASNSPPLPIAGPTDIGREYGVQHVPSSASPPSARLMSGGSVQIFGRSRFIPFLDSLFPVSSASFPLPAGGRLSSGDGLDPSAPPGQTEPWFGIAEIKKDGFRISATTATSTLYLYRPGATGETERFALDAFVGPLSDPSIILLTVLFGVITMTLKTVSLFVTLIREDKQC